MRSCSPSYGCVLLLPVCVVWPVARGR
eukprot:COSAG06_NODE_52672_length_304_cov_0.960976_1_plen_26_part_10